MGLIVEISTERIHIEEKIRGNFFIYLPTETMIYHTTGGPSSLCEFKMAVNIKDLYGNSGKRFKSIKTR